VGKIFRTQCFHLFIWVTQPSCTRKDGILSIDNFWWHTGWCLNIKSKNGCLNVLRIDVVTMKDTFRWCIPSKCSKWAGICWYTIPDLFVPEFNTGTYQYILYPFIFFHFLTAYPCFAFMKYTSGSEFTLQALYTTYYGAEFFLEANSHSLSQEIPAFYWTQSFTTVFTTTCHLTLLRLIWIQFMS
jgi:hypothetical protein